MYTKKEAKLLDHFFTNLDSNIYCVRNMPEEVWATFMGSYSRTHLHMRDNFLEKVRKGLMASLGNSDRVLGDDFDPLTLVPDSTLESHSVGMDYLMEVAGKFLGTWAITYGHNSLKDSATFRAAIEDVSIIASKEIEWSRLAAYQESSTRYMDYSTQGFYFDPELREKFGKEVEEIFNELRAFYVKASPIVLDHVKEMNPLPLPKMTNKELRKHVKAWDNACNAKAFDTVRYILPAAVLTKLGVTCSVRSAEHSITKYLSSPLHEVREIGAKLLEEGRKIFPTLLNHAGENEYMVRYLEDMHLLSKILLGGMEPDTAPKVSLVNNPEDLEERLVASLLSPGSNLPFEQVLKEVKTYSSEKISGILEAALRHRGKHDALTREFEEGILEWDVLMDYGGFRDVQRHRIGTHSKQLLTTEHGFDMPKLLTEVGLDDECNELMQKVSVLHNEISNTHPFEAQYIVPLGFRIRDRIIFNPRQTAYFIELRSGVNGHESYREVALMMHRILQQVAPNFAKHVKACYDDIELGRFDEELKSEDKKEKLDL